MPIAKSLNTNLKPDPMKNQFRNAALVATMMLASATFAQDKPAGSPPPRPAVEQKMQAMNMDVPMLVEKLGLDQDQMGKLKEIDAKTQNEMASLKGMDEADKTMKMQEIVADRTNMVKEVLTPVQKEKFQALMKEKAVETAPVMEAPMEEETK